jgi:hypothetical protein
MNFSNLANKKPRARRKPFKKNKDMIAYWLERFYIRLMSKYLAAQQRAAAKRNSMDILQKAQHDADLRAKMAGQ